MRRDPEDLIVRLAELARAPLPRDVVGGKALHLARLWAAGLPVPDGVVVSARVAALDEPGQAGVLAEVRAYAEAHGGRWAVRSSAAIEDSVAAQAPGVFASVLGVEPADVDAAVRQVWASAQTPLVRAYAAARGVAELALAVIVQRQVPGVSDPPSPSDRAQVASGVLYTRLPGRESGDEALLETRDRGDRPPRAIRMPRSGPPPVGSDLPLAAPVLASLRDHGLRAEEAIHAPRGADVEWVAAGARVWIVQARPIVHPPARSAPPYPETLLAFSRAEPEEVWRLDVTHNPDPLSLAQAGLVERMDAARLAPYRMRVVGGYLYTASPRVAGEREALADISTAELGRRFEALGRRFDEELQPAMEAALIQAESPDAALATVLDAYARFYRVYAAELSPCISAARPLLPAFLHERFHVNGARLASELLAGGSPARLETLIARVAGGQERFETLLDVAGAMSPAWDVACATFAETPALLRQAVERAAAGAAAARMAQAARAAAEQASALRARLDPAGVARLDACLALAATARDLAELDDRFYARAQAAVRRALLRQAERWRWPQQGDIFHVPLDDVLAWSEHGHAPEPRRVRRMAQAGRAARERQRAWLMPLAFANGRPVEEPVQSRARDVWTGQGAGGRVRGPALRLTELSDTAAITAGCVVVTATVTPAMAFAVQQAAGIVCEHGGLLDHGAAMARELGIPCVVGCARAWAEIRTGDSLWLDGDAGLVMRLGGVAL